MILWSVLGASDSSVLAAQAQEVQERENEIENKWNVCYSLGIHIFVRRRRCDGRSSALLTIQISNLQPTPSSRSWNFLYQYNLFVLSELSLDSLENKKIWTIID